MSQFVDIRLPDLTDGQPRQQLQQIRSYLYQLAGQLQFALGAVNQAQVQTAQEVKTLAAAQNPTASFTSLKSLIIKSADIVDAYTETISRKLESVYVAQSAFGTYAQQAQQQIEENADGIRRSFTNQQQILGAVSQLESQILDVSAYVKTGLLYYDGEMPVYGVEIGQKNQADGVVTFQKYTRLCAGKLSFYDSDDREVAFISDSLLTITRAEIYALQAQSAAVGKLQLGNYTLQEAGGHLTLA